jgi:tetratricopeptide (TPR) repeat protein
MPAERRERQTGPVIFLYPRLPAVTETDQLYLAMAQVQSSSDPMANAKKLAALIRKLRVTAPEPYIVLAEGWRKDGRSTEALQAYREALKLGSREPRVLVATGEILMQLGGIDEAVSLLESAILDAPRVSAFRNTLAVLYGRKERFAEAIKILEEARQIDADDPVTWLNLGVCRQALGQKSQAAACYREAIRLQPDFTRARQYLQALAE